MLHGTLTDGVVQYDDRWHDAPASSAGQHATWHISVGLLRIQGEWMCSGCLVVGAFRNTILCNNCQGDLLSVCVFVCYEQLYVGVYTHFSFFMNILKQD